MTDPVVAPKTAPKPVTTRHLAYELAEQHQLAKKQGLEMMEELVSMITKHLKKGERVKIAGLGILQVRNRAARMGRNPATGEAIQIKASRKVAFRATKELSVASALPHKLNSAVPCFYYFFLAVVVIRYETTATAVWALLFIVRAFFNDTITVAVWTGSHVCALVKCYHTPAVIRW